MSYTIGARTKETGGKSLHIVGAIAKRRSVSNVFLNDDSSLRGRVGALIYTPGQISAEIAKTDAFIMGLAKEIAQQLVWPVARPSDESIQKMKELSGAGGSLENWVIVATFAKLPDDVTHKDFLEGFGKFLTEWDNFRDTASTWWYGDEEKAVDFLRRAIDWRGAFTKLGGKTETPVPTVVNPGVSFSGNKLLLILGIVAAIFILPPALRVFAK